MGSFWQARVSGGWCDNCCYKAVENGLMTPGWSDSCCILLGCGELMRQTAAPWCGRPFADPFGATIHVKSGAVQTFPLWCDWKCCVALCAVLVPNVMNSSLSSSRLNHSWLIPWLPLRVWAVGGKPCRVLHTQHSPPTLTATLLRLLLSVFTSGVFL